MSDELVLASTTDGKEILSRAVQGLDARVEEKPMESEQLDGSTVVSFEHPRSERAMLLERLVAAHEQKFAERELQTIQTNDVPETPEVQSDVDEPKQTEQAAEVERQRQEYYRQQQASHFAATPVEQELQQLREELKPAFTESFKGLASPEELADWSKHPEKMNVPMHQKTLDALLSIPSGAAVALHLMRHPETARAWAFLPPDIATYKAIELAGKLDSQQDSQQRSKPAPPSPIRPLSGGNTRSSQEPSEMSFREFRRWRDEQERNRYRR